MVYHLALHPTSEMATVWFIDETTARRVDAQQVVDVPPGADPITCILATHPGWRFVPLKLAPGEYYPRMARPSSTYPYQSPGANPESSNKNLVETGRGQLAALREQLERIFRTVHPTQKNFAAYGHDIRNVLILAATEVEAHWKGILKANGKQGESTKDYVKLQPAMKLDEFSIMLPFYPWLDPVRPFASWTTALSTQSLQWYDAYNAVKHDRETSFERGTLFDALQAVCAVAVILFAQFGKNAFHNSREINSFFELIEAPKWDGSEVYTKARSGESPKAKPFPF